MRLIKGSVSVELDEAARKRLEDDCLHMARAGVRPTMAEWQAMEDLEREVFESAVVFAEREKAVWYGLAAQGREGLMQAVTELDGGRVQNHVFLEMAVAKAARRMNTRHFAATNKETA